MSYTFKKSLLALLLVLAIAVLAAFTLNLGFLRGFLEQRLSETTGHSVEISGPLDIRLGSVLRIKASQITLSNPGWATDPQVAQIQGLVVNAKLAELLSDTVRIRSVTIENLDLTLAQDAQMRGNWQPQQPGESSSQGAPLLVDAVHIGSGSGQFVSPRLDAPLSWRIASLNHELSPDGSMLLVFDGELGGKAAQLRLSGGPWAAVLGNGSAAFELSAALGQVSVQGAAEFDQLWTPHRPKLRLGLAGPDFEALAATFGIHGLGSGPLDLNIESREEQDRLRIDARGRLGELQIDSSIVVDSLSETRVASIDGQLSGPNFGRLMRLAAYPDWPESRFEASLNSELEYPRLQVRNFDLSVAGASIKLEGTVPALPLMSGAEITLTANGPALAPFARVVAIDDAPAGPFSVSGRVYSAENRSDIDLAYRTSLANGTVSGTIGNGQLLEGTRLHIKAGRSDASRLGQALGFAGLPAAPWTFDLEMGIPDQRVYRIESAAFETRGLSAQANGALGRETLRRDSDMRFSISGQRLSDYQSLLGEDTRLPGQPFKAGGRVSAIAEGWKLEGVSANVGEDRIELSGVLGSAEDLAGTRLAVKASGTDAARFLPGEATMRLPAGAYQLDSNLALQQGRIILSESAFSSGPLSIRGSADIPWPLNSENGRFDLLLNSKDITALMPTLGNLEFNSNPLDIRARGSWREGRIQLDAAELKAGLTTLSAQGTLDLPPNLSATALEINAFSPDLAALGTLSGKRWDPVVLDLKSAFTGTQTTFTMSRFNGRLGDSNIQGTLSVDFAPDIPEFDVQFSSASLDLRPFQADEEPVAEGAKTTRTDTTMIPDLAFPLDTLAKVQGQFEVRAERLLMRNTTLRDSVVRGSLRDGVLDVGEFSTAGYRGRLNTAFKLSPLVGGNARLSSTIRSEGLVLNLAQQSAEEKDLLPAFDIDISISGDGAGLKQAMAGLNGKIRIGSEGGRLPNVKARSASGLFLSQVLSTISPSAARQRYIQISCFATAADIRGGIIALDPGVAMQSDKLNVFMTGKINLANESLDASLRTETRKTVDISASELVSPYVKLSGTLSKPSLKIDPKGTLLSGGAAYLSGGLSILAKKALDQLGGTSNPCDGYLEGKEGSPEP